MTSEDRSRLVQLESQRVFVRDMGPKNEQTPVLLLHDLFLTQYEFRHLLGDLRQDRRTIAVDFPGCGDSDRPDPARAQYYSVSWLAKVVVEVMQSLEIEHFDVVGHGIGGTVAIELGFDHPQRVGRMVLVAPVVFGTELPLIGRINSVPFVGRRMFVTLFRRLELQWYLRHGWAVPEAIDEVALSVYWDRLGRKGGREAAWAMLRQLEHLDFVRDRLSSLACTVSVLLGDHDPYVPIGAGERLLELVSDGEFEVIEGTGHFPLEERPEAAIRGVCRGLARPLQATAPVIG